jgi:hypothetical protein
MNSPDDDNVPRDAWLREALRHAPDAEAAPSHKVDENILRMGRAAVAPRTERPVHATQATMPSSGSWTDGLASLWAWLAQPPIAAGFAGVMVATLVGVMWWGRSPEEMQPPQEVPVAASPSTPAERAAGPAAPPAATAALPDAARKSADALRMDAATPAPEAPARKMSAAPSPKAEAPVVAAAPPAPAPAAMPAAPPAQNAATADMAARARQSEERRDLAAAKLAAPAGAAAPQTAAAASTALETPGFSNLRFEIRRKPAAWTWTRDDGAARAMDDATEAWIAQADRSARTVWQAGAVGADQSTTTLRFTRDGVVRAVLRLGPTGMRLTRGGKTESAELSRGQAAALLSSLDALGP